MGGEGTKGRKREGVAAPPIGAARAKEDGSMELRRMVKDAGEKEGYICHIAIFGLVVLDYCSKF